MSKPLSASWRVLGVYEPDDPGSYGEVQQFARVTHVTPDLVVYYSNWGQPFASAFANEDAANGARTLVQIELRGVSIAAIAAGQQDAYLRSFARQVRAYGRRVIISFGQEMNGNWYPWGAAHITSLLFIAAWRHIVTVFRRAGAKNVTWLWDVNCDLDNLYPVAAWWPGAKYVNWTGIDCYYVAPADTFAERFEATITEIRQLTRDPIMIAETAIAPSANENNQMAGLFAGVHKYDLSGLVWFDVAQHAGAYHQDWRLEGHPRAIADFRHYAKAYLRGRG